MNISINTNVNISTGGMIVGGGGMDEEYKRIVERMLALGLTPTGNKSSDKAKLRDVEMQMLKSELGTKGKGSVNTGKYVTISPAEIKQIKEKLQEKAKDEDPDEKAKRADAENMTGAEQQALLNKWFIKKKISA